MKRHAFLPGAASALALMTAAPVLAQEMAEDRGAGFGDIIVTATKRSENLQSVGISVSAYSGDQLERLGISNTTEITQQIPGLHLNQFSPGLTIFSLRGVSQNNFTDNLEAPVAVYMDNAYMGSINGVSGQLFDTERVEVLRGPQGTLFGRNATGGLIHYLSRDASDDAFNGYAETSYGRFDDFSIEGAVGGAIAQGVRFRVAGRYNKADGYIKSRDTDAANGLVGSGQDLGGKDGWAGRINLQFDVTPDFLLNLWYKHSEDNRVATGGYVFENCDFEPNGYCHVNAAGLSDGRGGVINGITGEPASPYEHFGDRPGHLDRNVNIWQADFTWKLADGIELTSITNHTRLTKDYGEDGDALPVLVINFDTDVKYKQFSQEFRLSGETGRLKWQTGLYYLDMKLNGGVITAGAPVLGSALDLNGGFDNPAVIQSFLLDSKNWSIFGQVDYALTDQLNLIVGGRYSSDDKKMNYNAILTDPNFAPDTVLASSTGFDAAVPGVNKISYDDWAARVALEYKPTDDTLLFASWNRGIKGGNWSLATDIQPQNFKHGPETLNSFELGFKTAMLDRTLKINGTLFHYLYDNYQAFSLAGGTPQVTNSDARSTGAELEVFWSPSPRFDAILGATWQKSSVDEVPGAAQQAGPELFPGAPDAQYCVNQGGFFLCDFPQDVITKAKFPNAPRFSLNYLLRYNVDVPALGGNVALQVDGAWYDKQYLEVTNGPSSLQPSYNVTNASLAWKHDRTGIGLQAWVKNLFKEEYRLYTLNLGILGTTSVYAPPRTYGLTARLEF